MLWAVPTIWPGQTAAILASGPSMTREIAQLVRGRVRAVAVNNQAIPTICDGQLVPAFAPWADVLYAADRLWWKMNEAAAVAFPGLKVTIEDASPLRRYFRHEAVHVLQNSGTSGYEDRPTHMRTGRNSGYQAVHLAAKFGATRILLCGFDMQEGANGRAHWFGDHQYRPQFASPYHLFMREFERGAPEFAKRGIEIINCTPGSALKCFPYQPIEDAIRESENDRLQRVRESATVRPVGAAAQA